MLTNINDRKFHAWNPNFMSGPFFPDKILNYRRNDLNYGRYSGVIL